MTELEKKEAKQRILDTAVKLFAQRGYAAVGVREIAAQAEVNLAMISYYFNGKVGILQQLLLDFHEQYYQAIKEVVDRDLTGEESVRDIVRSMIFFVKENYDLTLVMLNTIPLDIPEITELKKEKVGRLIEIISGLMQKFELDPNNKIFISMLGPTFISTISSHFRFRSIQQKIFDIQFDDAFYEKYSDFLGTLFLEGIKGISKKTKKGSVE